jgi:RHS repeat-associated protein
MDHGTRERDCRSWKAFFPVIAFFLVLPISGGLGAQPVGELPGEFSVSPQGAANYRVPIGVPPGVNGMAPDLALLYSSHAGNGHLGRGWSLTGLSAVSRCAPTYVQDGQSGAVSLDNSDAFCLDGQRLIRVSGTHGTSGAEYRTEIESFQRVRITSSSSAGPATFQVHDRSGLIRYYGGAGANVEADNGARMTWPVRRIEDRFGNWIEFAYTIRDNPLEYYPREITYGNANGVEVARVEIDYQQRPDVSEAWVGPELTGLTRRATRIATYSSGSFVREYRLQWESSWLNGESLLVGIELCASGGSCLPATEFEWDLRSPFLDAPNLLSSDDPVGLQPIDVFGNGRQVLFYIRHGYWHFYEDDTGHERNTGIQVECHGKVGDCERFHADRMIALDFTGDGRLEVLAPVISSGPGESGYFNIWRLNEDGLGFSLLQHMAFTASGGSIIDYRHPSSGDFTGNGRPDIVFNRDGQLIVYEHTGSGFQRQVTGFLLNAGHRLMAGNFRPNGRADLLVHNPDCANNGAGEPTKPTADFGYSCSDLECHFGGGSSGSGGSGYIESYEWTFGDGNSASGKDVSHTFPSPGNYSVRLRVTNNYGLSDSRTRTVAVDNPPIEPPDADFDHSCNNLNCSFDASSTSEGSAPITSYGWYFGDGATGSGKTVSHSYSSGGSYTVGLLVRAADGGEDYAQRSVSVSSGGGGGGGPQPPCCEDPLSTPTTSTSSGDGQLKACLATLEYQPAYGGFGLTHWISEPEAMPRALPLDLAGDGFDDIVYSARQETSFGSDAWSVVVNRGGSFNCHGYGTVGSGVPDDPGVPVMPKSVDGEVMTMSGGDTGEWCGTGSFWTGLGDFHLGPVSVLDHSRNGRPDLALYDGSRWHAARWEQHGLATSQIGGLSMAATAAARAIFFDPRADGYPAVLYYWQGWQLRRPDPDSIAWNAIMRIESGTGRLTRVAYAHGNRGSAYDGALDDGLGEGGAVAYPVRHARRLPPVVRAFGVDSGLTENGERQLVVTSYRYGGAKEEVAGRGFLGFRRVLAHNHTSGITTANLHRQDFPFTGMVEASWQLRNPDMPPTTVEETDWMPPEAPGEGCFGDDVCPVEPQGGGGGGPVIMSTGQEECSVSTLGLPGTRIKGTCETLDAKSLNGGRTFFPYAAESVETDYDLSTGAPLRTQVTRQAYDDWGNAVEIEKRTRPGGPGSLAEPHETITVNEYDDDPSNWCLGRLTHTTVTHEAPGTGPVQRMAEFEYDGTSCHLTAEIEHGDGRYKRTDYGFDAFGNRDRATVSGTDIVTRESRSFYDPRGRFVEERRNAKNHVETLEWDERFGRQTRHVGPNGIQTQWTFDAFGRTRTHAPQGGIGHEITRGWCSGDCGFTGGVYFVRRTHDDGGWEETVYDRLGREVGGRSQGYSGIVISEQRHDPLGRVWLRSLPRHEGQTACYVQTRYDALGRPVIQAQPASVDDCSSSPAGSGWAEIDPSLNSRAEWTYAGLVTTVTEPEGRVVQREKNAAGQLVRVVKDPGGLAAEASYAYDATGNKRRVTAPGGAVTRIFYDDMGHKRRMEDPDMGVWIYEHNVLGQLVRQTDAKGQVTEIEYDTLGRRAKRISPEGIDEWHYDESTHGASLGRLTRETGHDDYEALYFYDALGRLESRHELIHGEYFQVAFGYDGLGRSSTITYPMVPGETEAFRVGRVYDPDTGHLTEVRRVDSAGNGLQSFWQLEATDALGNVVESRYGNNVTDYRVYDRAHGGLISTDAVGTDGLVQALAFEWNREGHLKRREAVDLGHVEDFDYDALYRLRSSQADLSSVASPQTQTYAYDLAGNLRDRGDAPTDYRYEGNGHPHAQPHAVTRATANGSHRHLVYDANGNATQAGDRSLEWTSFNKPRRITRGGVYSRFDYRPDRSRYFQVGQTEEGYRRIVYIGQLYERVEISDGGTEHRFQVSAGGGTVAVHSVWESGTEQTRYWHRDHLGSVTAVTGEAGTLVERFSYEVWGKRRDGVSWKDGPLGQFMAGPLRGFQGHEHLDHVGLIHMNGRVYDPELGRFLSPDPFVQFPESTQNYNRYTYVGNNPLSYTDPSGYFIAVVVMAMASQAATSVATAALIGAIAGYMATGTTRGALIGAVSGAVAFGIGEAGSLGMFDKAMAQGLSQGAIGHAGGGRFGDGFLGAFVGSYGAPVAGTFESPAMQTIAVATVGGSASKLGGGSFTNGATSAAFAYAFGQMARNGSQGGGSAASGDGVDLWELSGQVESALAGDAIINATDQAAAALAADAEWVNPTGGGIRGCDSQGCGHFGANRRYGPHRGADYETTAGQQVVAPHSGRVRVGHPYRDDLSYYLIEIQGPRGHVVRSLYVSPADGISTGGTVRAGQVIGTAQDLTPRYPGITNHVHVDIRHGRDFIDPTTLIPGG